MRFVPIFACGRLSVMAARFEFVAQITDVEFYPAVEDHSITTLNEFDKAVGRWADPEYLRCFFRKYQKDLAAFDFTLSARDAVGFTRADAKLLFEKMDDLVSRADEAGLNRLFKPLFNSEGNDPPYDKQPLKGRGFRHKSWLRIYAIRYWSHIIITGAAIKLTKRMHGRPHLELELYKLKAVREVLEDKDHEGIAGYIDLYNNE